MAWLNGGCEMSFKQGICRVRLVLLGLVLASGLAGTSMHGPVKAETPEAAGEPVAVSRYCERFARTYTQMQGMDYREHSAGTGKKGDIMMWATNFFQPKDSRFTAGFDCRFQGRDEAGEVHHLAVAIFLTKTLHFAEYTQWPKLQVIPIAYVVDETSGREGYGVFKYLETH